MTIQRMIHRDVIDLVDAYSLQDALCHLDVPLVVTFVALNDDYTPAGIRQENGKTYLVIRLPLEYLRTCKGSALEFMKVLLLSRIRHLKHLDWYDLYYKMKKALYEEVEVGRS